MEGRVRVEWWDTDQVPGPLQAAWGTDWSPPFVDKVETDRRILVLDPEGVMPGVATEMGAYTVIVEPVFLTDERC